MSDVEDDIDELAKQIIVMLYETFDNPRDALLCVAIVLGNLLERPSTDDKELPK